MPGIIVDIGTGDGEFAYKLAKDNPDRLVIGIDPNHSNLIKTSSKIYKKTAKGGLNNALYVLASIEDLPEELNGIANQVFINFPWGALLEKIVLVNENSWKNIARICQENAIIDLLLGYNKDYDLQGLDKTNFPEFNETYINREMLPHLKSLGFMKVELRKVSKEEIKNYPSSWGKKLAYGKEREFYFLRLQVTKD